MEANIRKLSAEILDITEDIKDDIIALRRTFHQYPELSWKEVKTGRRIEQILRELHLDVESGVCGTGLVADIKRDRGGPTIAVRADMDALPMHDDKNVPYASKIPGVMHACGHDSHMAMALGVAKVLTRLGKAVPGNVRLIFQPSEEAMPSGARELVNRQVMSGVDRIVACHVDPLIDVGKIGLRSGVLTANCDEFQLTIFGRSGHAARPHHSVDTIFVATHVLHALYEIVGSRTETYMPAVLSVGKIAGGTKSNVLPERVEIFGTIRTVDETNRAEMMTAVERRVYEITRAFGATFQLEFPGPVPSVRNDADTIDLIRGAAEMVNHEDGIVDISTVSMGGEDFSWYLTKAPGALIRLGARKPGEDIQYLHTHTFDIDERAIPFGISIMTTTIIKYLLENQRN